MATCDPDGRIFEAVLDRQKCLAMEMSESLIEAETALRAAVAPLTSADVEAIEQRLRP